MGCGCGEMIKKHLRYEHQKELAKIYSKAQNEIVALCRDAQGNYFFHRSLSLRMPIGQYH